MKTPSVSQLRKSGFKVRVMHQRYIDGRLENYSKKTKGRSPSTKGGLTTVELSQGDKSVLAMAECSRNDPFCYRTGVKIATQRALHKLKKIQK